MVYKYLLAGICRYIFSGLVSVRFVTVSLPSSAFKAIIKQSENIDLRGADGNSFLEESLIVHFCSYF